MHNEITTGDPPNSLNWTEFIYMNAILSHENVLSSKNIEKLEGGIHTKG